MHSLLRHIKSPGGIKDDFQERSAFVDTPCTTCAVPITALYSRYYRGSFHWSTGECRVWSSLWYRMKAIGRDTERLATITAHGYDI
jgi:hypothetical protein